MTELAAQTFLLVENDNRIRKALAALLREMGHTEILQARTGTEAWSLFKQFQPDLIVSSWDLPEMNGLVLLK
ncbi:MAG: response regulator, partial [Proteobacteria bacterium]|nr:response regulator [Pseudomonadota bacterium]